jgi:hypothetical protein
MKLSGIADLITRDNVAPASELMRVRALYATGTPESGCLGKKTGFMLSRPKGRARTHPSDICRSQHACSHCFPIERAWPISATHSGVILKASRDTKRGRYVDQVTKPRADGLCASVGHGSGETFEWRKLC